MKCLTIHISSLPSACPDLAQQVHRTLCQCCEEDVAATRQPLKSGLFVPLSLHLNSCCWECFLPLALPCAVLEDLIIFLSSSSSVSLYRSHDFFSQCIMISALMSYSTNHQLFFQLNHMLLVIVTSVLLVW